jgi:hypothetical protein
MPCTLQLAKAASAFRGVCKAVSGSASLLWPADAGLHPSPCLQTHCTPPYATIPTSAESMCASCCVPTAAASLSGPMRSSPEQVRGCITGA